MDRIRKLQFYIILTQAVLLLGLIILSSLLQYEIIISLFVWFVSSILILSLVYFSGKHQTDSKDDIKNALGGSAEAAFDFGTIGFLTYDHNYVITWMSDIFFKLNLVRTGKKLLSWLPECADLIQGEVDEVVITFNNNTFLVKRKEDEAVLLFKDITEVYELKNRYNKEKVVVGSIYLDNYDETTQYEDEQEKSYINNNIRQPVVDWCNNNGIIVKSMRSNRFYVVLNESILEKLIEERFSILETTKRSSRQIDVAITLSMAFARGSSDFKELDETCSALLELAQSRGGDQVAMRIVGEEIKFFGGNSEAQEKRSKVRVRIMAHTIRDMIVKASNVIIVGHKEMDSDCIGAALAMSNIVKAYHKQVSIIAKTGGIEPGIADVMKVYKDELSQKHQFVTESEAQNQLGDDTLVIMVDHHDISISNGQNLLKNARKIAIFDHHRRKADLAILPSLIYIVTASSSTTEVVNEFIPYLSKEIEYDAAEANIMYLGLIIDTNNFVLRTGSRTFVVASMLRQRGADPLLCDQLMKEPYEEFVKRSTILNYAEKYANNIIVAPCDGDAIYSRTLLSQAANQLLKIKGIEAVFVIAKVDKEVVAISSRSIGTINVQVLMEKMKGGGHLTQAAMQRSDTSVIEIKTELEAILDNYMKEESNNESNPVE